MVTMILNNITKEDRPYILITGMSVMLNDNYIEFKLCFVGRIIAQADSCRLLSAAVRVQSQLSLYGIILRQSATEAGFVKILRFPTNYRSNKCFTSIICSWYYLRPKYQKTKPHRTPRTDTHVLFKSFLDTSMNCFMNPTILVPDGKTRTTVYKELLYMTDIRNNKL